jgi:hypothetical protein
VPPVRPSSVSVLGSAPRFNQSSLIYLGFGSRAETPEFVLGLCFWFQVLVKTQWSRQCIDPVSAILLFGSSSRAVQAYPIVCCGFGLILGYRPNSSEEF